MYFYIPLLQLAHQLLDTLTLIGARLPVFDDVGFTLIELLEYVSDRGALWGLDLRVEAAQRVASPRGFI
jgi:hypothetical protein